MKTHSLYFLLVVVLLSCTQPDISGEPESDSVWPQEEVSQECLDKKLEQWFLLFHQYQHDGDDMYEADIRAKRFIGHHSTPCSRLLKTPAHHTQRVARR